MTAVLIPFPTTARAALIRRTTDVLRRKHGREADRYFRQRMLVLRAELTTAGFEADVIDRELRSFAQEVFSRLPLNPTGRTA